MKYIQNDGIMLQDYSFSSGKRSKLFELKIQDIVIPVVEYPGIEPEDYARIAAEYRQMHAACWVEARFMAVHYAHIAAEGPLNIEITAAEEIKSYCIYPKRKGVFGQSKSRQLRFSIDQPKPNYLIIDINEMPLLCIIVDPPLKNHAAPPEKTVYASQFLSDATGNIDQTTGFEEALKAVDGSGKVLVVPAGTYLTDTIRIENMSNFTICFEPGVLIRTLLSEPGENRHSHGIWINQSSDITLFGPVVVDHQAYENFQGGRNNFKHGLISWAVSNEESPYTSMSPLCITRSKRITVEHLMVRNSRNFNFNVRRSDDVTFRYCKAISPPGCLPEYTDGFNINSCENLLIEDCFVFCNDDCFATGHYFDLYDDRASGEYVIRRLVGWNPRANGVRIGFMAYYNQGNMLFEDCDFIEADDSGVLIHPLRDSGESDRYQWYDQIHFSNCGFDNVHRYAQGLFLVYQLRMRSLVFSDITIDGLSPTPSRILGHPTDLIGRLTLKNFKVGNRRLRTPQEAAITIEGVKDLDTDEM